MDRTNGKISTVIQSHIIYTQAVFSVASFKQHSTSWQVCQSSVCIPWCLYCVKVFTESCRETFQSPKHPEVYQHTEGFTKDEARARHMGSCQEIWCDQCGCGLRSLRFGILYFYIHRGLLAVEERVGLCWCSGEANVWHLSGICCRIHQAQNGVHAALWRSHWCLSLEPRGCFGLGILHRLLHTFASLACSGKQWNTCPSGCLFWASRRTTCIPLLSQQPKLQMHLG